MRKWCIFQSFSVQNIPSVIQCVYFAAVTCAAFYLLMTASSPIFCLQKLLQVRVLSFYFLKAAVISTQLLFPIYLVLYFKAAIISTVPRFLHTKLIFCMFFICFCGIYLIQLFDGSVFTSTSFALGVYRSLKSSVCQIKFPACQVQYGCLWDLETLKTYSTSRQCWKLF